MGRLRLTFVLLLLLVIFSRRRSANAAEGNRTGVEEPILINCGSNGKSTGDDGRAWTTDDSFPNLSSTRAVTPSSQVSAPAVPFATARIFPSAFTYSIPVSGDRYFLRLYLYPSTYGDLSPSSAVFNVSCGDYTLLANFSTSYYGEALNLDYIVKEYSINVSSGSPGRLNLVFTPSSLVSGSYAFVNGIELVSSPDLFDSDVSLLGSSTRYQFAPQAPVETMYRLNVGGRSLSSKEDSGKLYRLWSDDSNYIAGGAFGISYSKDDNVSIKYPASLPDYIAPEAVYATARSMPWNNGSINLNYNMSWVLTVDPGFYYLIRLHFCEIQSIFTKANQRVFFVYIANQTAVADYDVAALSGGVGIPVYYDSVVVIPDADAQVDVWVSLHPNDEFKPQYRNVILNGLEVFKLASRWNLAGIDPTPLPRAKVQSGERDSPVGGSWPVIGGAIGGGVGLVLVIFLVVLLYRRKGKRGQGAGDHDWLPLSMISSDGRTTTVSGYTSDLCRHFTLSEIKAATRGFDEKLVLGVGGFGRVYRGVIDDGATLVAIKRANPMSEQGIHEFQNEIEMLSKLRHRHLVSLIGYCEENGEMILVYDYMAHGTLREHLYKTKNAGLSWKQRLEICIGAARGLHYLHTGAKYTIIHRDVKTTNILLDESWVAKVADFGLSKTGPSLDNTHVSTVVKGSFGYLDPEYFRRQQLTEKSDVFSFGVVLFEVLCARPALMRDLPKEQVSLSEWALYCHRKGVLEDILDPRLRGVIAPQCMKTFADTAAKCLADVGLDRPAMGDVLWNLELALQLQENAEQNGCSDGRKGRGGENVCDGCSDPNTRVAVEMISGVDDRSTASVDSDGLNSRTVFSQIGDPEGR